MFGTGPLRGPLLPHTGGYDAMTIKKKVATKYKLPTLNWVALKPNQVSIIIFLLKLLNYKCFVH